MSFLLDPQIVAALLTVALTVLAGAVGFFIRERLAQAKPFISTLSIAGENILSQKTVDIPAAVVESLRTVPILTVLDSKEPLRTVSRVLDEVQRFRDLGPGLIEQLNALKLAISNGERGSTEEALSKIIQSTTYDIWLTSLIGNGDILIPDDDKSATLVIPYNYEPDFKNGSFSIRLNGGSILFGIELNRFRMYRSNIERLLPIISKLEYAKLSAVFEQVENSIRRCIAVSKDAAPIIEDIINQHSQWTIRLFLANLGSTPFLVNPTAMLEVRDTTGAVYSEECELFLIGNDSEGDETNKRTEVPLVVRAQSDILLGFVTKKTQAEMERGGAFREVYKSGKATCKIEFVAQQTGLSRTASFQSPKVSFQSRA